MKTLEMGPGALAEYYSWANSASNGDVLVYWVGDLQYDRQQEGSPFDPLSSSQATALSALNAVADRILADSKAGVVTLTQRRLGESRYEYRATRKRQSFEAPKKEAPRVRRDDLVLA
jgi:hypothetical protein